GKHAPVGRVWRGAASAASGDADDPRACSPRPEAQGAGRTYRRLAGRVTAWDWPAAQISPALSGGALSATTDS
ncbi:hypothetical protein, partial [Streptomyces sp. KR80]|uniref:hypothetical protein n=1 Tax=Streptomyces sp. KR80 TaxID=3457426 RepID=UPI003FD0AE9C